MHEIFKDPAGLSRAGTPPGSLQIFVMISQVRLLTGFHSSRDLVSHPFDNHPWFHLEATHFLHDSVIKMVYNKYENKVKMSIGSTSFVLQANPLIWHCKQLTSLALTSQTVVGGSRKHNRYLLVVC